MSLLDKFKIEISGEIGAVAAESYASKIRAVMRNDIVNIELVLKPDCEIRSAEFMAFLKAAQTYLKASGGGLVVKGTSDRTRDLFQIARVGLEIVSEGGKKGGSS